MAAIVSAGIAAVPVPGLSLQCDIAILITEGNFYYKQLGLDDKSLVERARAMSTDVRQLIEIVCREFPNPVNVTYIKTLSVSFVQAGCTVLEEVSRFIPIIGSMIALPISLFTKRYMLLQMIDRMESSSLELTKSHATAVHVDDD